MIEKLSGHVPHLLLAGLCAGIASANAVRVQTATVPLLAVAVAALAAALPRARFALLAIGLVLAGSWWGALRLEAIDRSPMSAEVGRAAVARVTVTGPARRTQFALRIPARIDRFGGRDVREPVLLQLPVGRSPPQGSILELPVLVAAPRSSKDGFDERRWLRRHGVHVVLRGRDPEVVGRRGGLGGVADRLRAAIATALASACPASGGPCCSGSCSAKTKGSTKTCASVPGVGPLSPARSLGQNVALVAGGVLARCVAARDPAHGGPGRRTRRDRRVRARRRRATVGRTGRSRGRARISRVDVRSSTGSLVVPAPRRPRAARVEPVQRARLGFQLSFSAVAAIFTLVPRLMRWLEGYPLPRAAAAVVAVSIACGVATAPILLFQFGSVPAYSMIANAIS